MLQQDKSPSAAGSCIAQHAGLHVRGAEQRVVSLI